MINTISKTLEAQEKTQDIKQSPSTKMETKLNARSRRNELGRGDRTWPYEDRTRPISCSVTAGVSSSDRTLSEAVTGHTDFTVHRQQQRSQCDRTRRQDDLTHPEAASDHVQRGSRAAPAQPDASDQLLGNSRRQQQRPDAERGSDRTHGLYCSSSRQ